MEVKIIIEVNGKAVSERTAAIDGTLEEMEETAIALGRRVACETLQASVNAVEAPRPPFRPNTVPCGTKATKPARCSA